MITIGVRRPIGVSTASQVAVDHPVRKRCEGVSDFRLPRADVPAGQIGGWQTGPADARNGNEGAQGLPHAAKKERLKAGNAYIDSGYVLVNELGQPQRTDWLRRRVYELMAKVGVRKVRPYDARHTCLTYLAGAGVPDVVLAAWAGHADGGTLAKRVYVHPDSSHLRWRPSTSNQACSGDSSARNSAVRAYVRSCETKQQRPRLTEVNQGL
ncbi:tyrosine-type recombinase/integrase [Micromonospora sp. M12]